METIANFFKPSEVKEYEEFQRLPPSKQGIKVALDGQIIQTKTPNSYDVKYTVPGYLIHQRLGIELKEADFKKIGSLLRVFLKYNNCSSAPEIGSNIYEDITLVISSVPKGILEFFKNMNCVFLQLDKTGKLTSVFVGHSDSFDLSKQLNEEFKQRKENIRQSQQILVDVQSVQNGTGGYDVNFRFSLAQISQQLGLAKTLSMNDLAEVLKTLQAWRERQDNIISSIVKTDSDGICMFSFINVTKEQQEYLKQMDCLFVKVDDKKELIFADIDRRDVLRQKDDLSHFGYQSPAPR